MSNTIYTFIPKFIRQEVITTPRAVITSERWNELWNLNITQGDHQSEILVDIVQNLVQALNNILINKTTADTHISDTTPHSATSTPIANRLVLRDAAGRAQVTAPATNEDIATLGTILEYTAYLNPQLSSVMADPSTLILRDAAGRAQVAVPLANQDIARLDTITTHSTLTSPHSAVSTPTASRIIVRDTAGRAQVAAPAAAGDIARKDTIDTLMTRWVMEY